MLATRINICWIIIIIFATVTGGCANSSSETKKEGTSTLQTGFELDARFHVTDSLVVVFYKDPYGADSLRYTRYYTQLDTRDVNDVQVFQQQVKTSFKKEEIRKHCRGEGKIWCYSQGRVFQTLYFSTRCPDCCYVMLIREGNFYYGAISDDFDNWLKQLKPRSIDPGESMASLPR